MPRSTPPPQRGTFYPPNDVSTYRDLLLFEERLKTNATSLKRRKSRYQVFLAQLLLVIVILMSDVLLHTSFLALPLNCLLRYAWPDRSSIVPHSYLTFGLLLIAVMTLVLFYASGIYAEKIGYANRYVPHANRALRSFNVYLNVRPPPLRTSLNPFSYFFPRLPTPSPSQQSSNAVPRGSSPRRPPPIPPIPPTSNPRGELIFSSRVEPSFREAYERYRAAFERKREERERAARGGWFGFLQHPWRKAKPQPQSQNQMQMSHGGGASVRGRTPSTTPSSSRRSSPAPGSKGSLRRGKASRSGTPVLEAAIAKDRDTHRTESFSFLLAGQGAPGRP